MVIYVNRYNKISLAYIHTYITMWLLKWLATFERATQMVCNLMLAYGDKLGLTISSKL